jgi:replicative DNA helicase
VSERKLPRNLDAEQSLIGGCIIDNAQIAVARETIATPEMFFRKDYGVVWEVIDDLDRKNFPVDLTTLVDELRRRNKLESVNGAAAVAALVDGVPHSTNVEYYAKLVKDYWLRRGMIFAAQKLLTLGYDSTDAPVEDIIAEAESTLLALSRDHMASDGFIDAETWAVGGMQLVSQLMESRSLVTGLSTGFKRLDFMTRGLQPGNLIIIAGRPSMGKTSLALQIAREASKRGSAGVVSLEMNKNELWMRALSLESEVNLSKILTGDIDEKTGPKLTDAAAALEQSGFFIDETPSIAVEQLRSRCKRLAVEHPLNCLVVDYLQLMDLKQRKGENLTTAVGRTTRLLKQTARELDIPIIVLSQLSRAPESRTDKRPTLSDLRDSGAIEQDADVVLLMFREEYYTPKAENEGLAEIIIAKQRNGPTGTVELYFEKRQTRFLSWADRPGSRMESKPS